MGGVVSFEESRPRRPTPADGPSDWLHRAGVFPLGERKVQVKAIIVVVAEGRAEWVIRDGQGLRRDPAAEWGAGSVSGWGEVSGWGGCLLGAGGVWGFGLGGGSDAEALGGWVTLGSARGAHYRSVKSMAVPAFYPAVQTLRWRL